MHHPHHSPRHSRTRGLAIGLIAVALGGCQGGGLIAPETPQSNAFLDQIGDTCGKLKIGNQPLDYLLDINNNDTYFIDEASKLSAGEVDKTTFASDINSQYPTGTNGPALECIFAQLEGNAP
jgi:hypothetical protein